MSQKTKLGLRPRELTALPWPPRWVQGRTSKKRQGIETGKGGRRGQEWGTWFKVQGIDTPVQCISE